MTVNFDQDYKLNQVRHQQKIDDAQRERDIREANGTPVRQPHEWVDHLAHLTAEVKSAWTASHRAVQNISKRRGATVKP